MAAGASRNRRADDKKVRLVTRPHSVPGLEDEQTPASRQQAPPVSDQAHSDGDRRSAASDRLAADGDQDAGDHEPAGGGDPEAHAVSRDVRQRTARYRQHSARARLDGGAARDEVADVRDQVALTRDRAAAARDLASAQRDIADQRDAGARLVSGAEVVMRAASERRRAATCRARGAEQRALATGDREAAADDREHAAAQRRHALADRDALAHHLAIIEIDPLTGARTRAAGLVDLDHERDRCHRTGAGLVLAYVHIEVAGDAGDAGDAQAHNGGDELLKRVVGSMDDRLRSYDLIIRFAASDVVCAMSNMTVPIARQRFQAIAAASGNAITTGFAALTSRQSTIELITRAQHGTAR
jgi:GGDEF domain-containing protein